MALDVKALREFQLHDCVEGGLLLDRLSMMALDLKTFTSTTCEISHMATVGFLRSLTSLEEFRLNRIERTADPKVYHFEALQHLGTALRILSIDDPDVIVGPHIMGLDEWRDIENVQFRQFEALCAACPNLEQIGILCPQLPEDDQAGDKADFLTFLDCLEMLKNLVAVKLYVYPDCLSMLERDRDSYHGHDFEFLQRHIQENANLIFCALATSCPRFTAPCTAARELNRRSEKLIGTYGFLRRTRQGCNGDVEAYGEPVSMDVLELEEPYNEIF